MTRHFTLSALITAIILFCTSLCPAQAIVRDELVEETLMDKELQNPYQPYKYNYEDLKRIPIELRVMVNIKSENDVTEGERIVFLACHDVYEKGHKILKKNEQVYAKVETIISSGMNGIPASIIIGNFQIDGVEKGQLTDYHEIRGLDWSLLVFPLKWALTILPPTGSFTNFIKGGHAKIKKGQKIELLYYPNWIIESTQI